MPRCPQTHPACPMSLRRWMRYWLPCLAHQVHLWYHLLWARSCLVPAGLSWPRGTWHREEWEGDGKVCVTLCCSAHEVPKCWPCIMALQVTLG